MRGLSAGLVAGVVLLLAAAASASPSGITISSVRFHEASSNGRPLGLVFEAVGTSDENAQAIYFWISKQANEGGGPPNATGCANSKWIARLLPPALQPGAFRLRVPTYWFAQTEALLPRTYDVCPCELTPSVKCQGPLKAKLVAGREGLVGRAWVSLRRNGAAFKPPTTNIPGDAITRKVPRKTSLIWAHFRFAVRPKLQPLVVTWYRKGRVFGSIEMPLRRGRVESGLKMPSNAPLPKGVWRVVLRAGGIPVGELRIKLL
jgi:hypothetical protein